MTSRKKTNDSVLFSPGRVGPYQLKNRLVALPVHTGFAFPDGRVSPWMIDFYSRLAASGAGLVVVANAAVSRDGVVSRFNLRADRDDHITGLTRLARAIRANGALACLQLNHAGRFAKTGQPLLPSPVTSANLAFNVESLKAFMEFFPFSKRFRLTRKLLGQMKTWRRAMTRQERERIVSDFCAAARRARQAGFDMVELHGANGYLLCQYLSAFTNRLPPPLGGNELNRMQFPLTVVSAVRNRLPDNFPLGFRLILREWVPGGIRPAAATAFGRELEKAGITYLSASSGTYNSLFSPAAQARMSQTAYLRDELKKLTAAVTVPVIASGRITRPAVAEALIRDRTSDLIGLGRPLRVDPGWVNHARGGRPRVKTCINCNWCIKQVILEQGFTCTRWPRLTREKTRLAHQLLDRLHNELWVVTGMDDLRLFTRFLPLLLADNIRTAPRLLVLRPPGTDPEFDEKLVRFENRVRIRLDPLGFAPWPRPVRTTGADKEAALLARIQQGDHGRIVLAASGPAPWQASLYYKLRRKILIRLNDTPLSHRIIVPVDLSQATLLAMAFLRDTLMRKQDVRIDFVHVTASSAKPVNRQWSRFKKTTGHDPDTPLRIMAPDPDVATTVVRQIRTGGYGIVVLGKRGLSGIKRWLLGSVSRAVLDGLDKEIVYLID